MASPSNLSLPTYECYFCQKKCHNYIEEINSLNEKVHYCSMKCFEQFLVFKRQRRESREYVKTPHIKELAKLAEIIKKEEAEAKEKMFRGDTK